MVCYSTSPKWTNFPNASSSSSSRASVHCSICTSLPNFLGGPQEIPKEVNEALLCHQSIEDWEENWLFRKKLKPQSGIFNTTSSLTMLTDDPVAMLVPLPNDEAGSKAQIGEKDIDQVSELSERLSEAGADSIDYSTTSSEENDLEHTEYSVTPLIRSSVSISRGSAKEMIKALKMDAELSKPTFVKIPAVKTVAAHGETVTFEAVTSGAKPIGDLLVITPLRAEYLMEESL